MSSAWHGWLKLLSGMKTFTASQRKTGGRGNRKRVVRFETLESRHLLTVAPTGAVYTISSDTLQDQKAPAVDIASDGDFVAAWTGTVETTVGSTTITHTSPFYRRYSATGQPLDAAQVAVSASTNNEDSVDVGVDASGNFVVVWVDTDGAGDKDIYFQRYNALGVAQGSATRANTTDIETTLQQDPHVAMADNGDFIIAWTHTPSSGNIDVYYRTYAASGAAKMAADAPVDSTSTYAKTAPDVDVNNLGTFAVAWAEERGGDKDVMFKVFRTDGFVLVASTQANTIDAGKDQVTPSVAIDNRGFVTAAWIHYETTSNPDVYLQRFDQFGSRRATTDFIVADTVGQEGLPLIQNTGTQMLVLWAVMSGAQADVTYRLYGDDLTMHGDTRTFQPGLHENAVAMAMNVGGEYVIAAERPATPYTLIEGVNFRNLDATAGLCAADPTTFYLRNSNTSGSADITYRFAAAVADLLPLAGDWTGAGIATMGLYDPALSRFYLSNNNATPSANTAFGYGAPGGGWLPIAGDWDGNGSDTIGLYDPNTSLFYLRNSNTPGPADITFAFGAAGAGWKPIAGHWTGTGADTVGLYDPTNAMFYLRLSNTSGLADMMFPFGTPNVGLLPVAGDWDLNGACSIGVYDPTVSHFLLSNTLGNGVADMDYGFGAPLAGWLPVASHWSAGAVDAAGLWDPSKAYYYLSTSNTSGFATYSSAFGPATSSWIALSGDWDGDGVTTAGLYDPALARVYLRNINSSGPAQVVYSILGVGSNLNAIAGDWDGDGVDSVSLYDLSTSQFHILNTQTETYVPLTPLGFGVAGAGWLPIAGDWSGSGVDGVGLYDQATSMFYLRNTVGADVSGPVFGFGAPGANWLPIAGDWNRDGTDTIGLYDPAASWFYQRNANSTGFADNVFAYGAAGLGWKPVMGDWNGVTSLPLMTYVLGDAVEPAQVTPEQVAPLVAAALDRWTQAGLSAQGLGALANIQYVITDLPGTQLAAAGQDVIWIDRDAAGHGWYLAASDSAFASTQAGALQAAETGAKDRIDLLSTLSHELGHVLGLSDLDSTVDSLMSARLASGVRRLPGPAEIDAALKLI